MSSSCCSQKEITIQFFLTFGIMLEIFDELEEQQREKKKLEIQIRLNNETKSDFFDEWNSAGMIFSLSFFLDWTFFVLF